MTFSAVDLLILFLAGLASGWVNVLAGGGSIVSVPMMVFLGLPGPVANGTNRIGVIAQCATAVWRFQRGGFANYRLGASLAACASFGAFFGAKAGVRVDGEAFERLLALIMIAILAVTLLGSGKQKSDDGAATGPKRLWLGHALFVVTGFWGGFIQIGIGLVQLPILSRVMGFDLVTANSIKVFAALIFTIVALAVFASEVEIAWRVGLALAVGNALGGWLGARSAMRGGERLIRMVFAGAIVVMAIKLLFF